MNEGVKGACGVATLIKNAQEICIMASLVNERKASERKDNKVTMDKKVCIEALLGRDLNDMKMIRR